MHEIKEIYFPFRHKCATKEVASRSSRLDQQPLLGRNARGFRRLRLAPGPRPARHRLAPQLTALRPLRRRATGVAQKRQPGVGCSLAPSPVAPSPGRPTAHGELGCSPPPPRVPRRRACPLPDTRPAPERMSLAQTEQRPLARSLLRPSVRRARRAVAAPPLRPSRAPRAPALPPPPLPPPPRRLPHSYPPAVALIDTYIQ